MPKIVKPNFWIASKDNGIIHFHRDDNAQAMCGKILSTKANPVDLSVVKWMDVCHHCEMVNNTFDTQQIPRRAA